MEEELDDSPDFREENPEVTLEEEKQDALCLIYLQHFSSSAGHEVLADLMRNFMYGQSVPLTPDSALVDVGRREVVQHIIDKMKAIDKRKAAEAVFNAECI